MRIVFSKHARDMLKERGLDAAVVEDVVAAPEWSEVGAGNVWYAFRRIGRKVLRVVVADQGETQVVKSQYFDRRVH